MQTVRDRDIIAWKKERQELYKQAKTWGIDEDTAFSLADFELANWTAEELSVVLRKIKGVKPGNARSMPLESSRMPSLLRTQTWIKAPDKLVRESAQEGKALCVNARGEFSLRDRGYHAISHVWIEGIQGDPKNRGLSSIIVDRIFKAVSVIEDVEWLWVDVLAIPSGHDTLNARQELEKIDIINSLGAIYENAAAVIVFDALAMHLHSSDLVNVAVVLACGKWMGRVWTYQEIKLARRAIVLTGFGPVEYSSMIQELHRRHNNMSWNDDLTKLTPDQLPARYKFRILYMILDVLQYDKDVLTSLPDVVFVCRRRTTGNEIDYARAFFPVLELKWKPGMTREDGMREIFDKRPYGYENAARIMLTFGRPRTMMWPGWAPDSLCGLSGMLFSRNVGFKHTNAGLVFSWTTYRVTSVVAVPGFQDAWLSGLESLGHGKKTIRCALFYCKDEQQRTIEAVQALVSKGQAFFLINENITSRATTGIVVSKTSNQYSGFVYMVLYIDAIEVALPSDKVVWTLHNENPLNDTLDGGQKRVDQMTARNQDNRNYSELDMATLLNALPTAINQQDNDGRTALHKAAARGDVDAVKALLAQGASVDTVDNDNATALNIAADQRRADVLLVLLQAGADIHHKGRFGPALTEAVISRTIDCVRILLEHGADPNGQEKDDFLWPLINAANQADMTELLLLFGADPNKCSPINLAALHFAARQGNVEVVRKLIAEGAWIDLQLSDGSRIDPLYYAIDTQAEDVVAELLFRGVNPNRGYVLNKTPLMLAASTGNAKVVEMLLASGADIQAKEDGTKTALDYAIESGKQAVIKLMLEALEAQ